MMSLLEAVKNANLVHIRQHKELAELFGFETRNKYLLEAGGQTVGFAAEQQKGLFGFLLRQFLGHWRRFDIMFFNADRNLAFIATHPFRWFFQRLEVHDPSGQKIGAIQQRFSLLYKKFDVLDARNGMLLEVASPIWKIWTFIFKRRGIEVAAVRKKWSGLLKEAFLDADRFELEMKEAGLSETERVMLLVSALFIDLQYFEAKAR